MENWLEMTPNGARRIFVLLIQTLLAFWATQILILSRACLCPSGSATPRATIVAIPVNKGASEMALVHMAFVQYLA